MALIFKLAPLQILKSSNHHILKLAFLFLPLCLPARTHHHHAIHMPHFKHGFVFFSGAQTLQVESYLNFESDGNQYTTAFPSLLLRYGIIDQLELRVSMDATNFLDRETNTYKTGLSPLQLGAKVRLNKAINYLPSFAVTASVTLPVVATAKFRETYYAPALLLSAEQSFGQHFSLEYDAGLSWDATTFQRVWLGSLNAEYDFTEKSSVYADCYFIQSSGLDIHADVGVNRAITKNLFFDLNMGAGFTAPSPDFYLSAGLQWIVFTGKRSGKWKQPGLR
ncbi:MAG: transporter [Chitinophagales bacterium]